MSGTSQSIGNCPQWALYKGHVRDGRGHSWLCPPTQALALCWFRKGNAGSTWNYGVPLDSWWALTEKPLEVEPRQGPGFGLTLVLAGEPSFLSPSRHLPWFQCLIGKMRWVLGSLRCHSQVHPWAGTPLLHWDCLPFVGRGGWRMRSDVAGIWAG